MNGSVAIHLLTDENIENLINAFSSDHLTIDSQTSILVPANSTIPFVACCGWVEKKGNLLYLEVIIIFKGHKNTAWQRRWLVLSDPKQTFCKSMLYFESNENGVIRITRFLHQYIYLGK